MRVVVYAEGSRDDFARDAGLPPPGDPLAPEMLGVAHVLVERCCNERSPVGVRFDAPQRVRARLARGSLLLHRMTLRKLLTWPTPLSKPDLAIVFVDADGSPDRYSLLQDHIRNRAEPQPPVVFAVPTQEFEAWLVGDEIVLRKTLGYSDDPLPAPEGLEPGRAKQLVQELLGSIPGHEHRARLLSLASEIDLQRLAKACPAFHRFRSDLRSAVTQVA